MSEYQYYEFQAVDKPLNFFVFGGRLAPESFLDGAERRSHRKLVE
jgi:hypothetical protein